MEGREWGVAATRSHPLCPTLACQLTDVQLTLEGLWVWLAGADMALWVAIRVKRTWRQTLKGCSWGLGWYSPRAQGITQ